MVIPVYIVIFTVMLFFAKKKIDDQVGVYNHINVLNIRVVFTNLKTTKS
jgi:hypothetical protein